MYGFHYFQEKVIFVNKDISNFTSLPMGFVFQSQVYIFFKAGVMAFPYIHLTGKNPEVPYELIDYNLFFNCDQQSPYIIGDCRVIEEESIAKKNSKAPIVIAGVFTALIVIVLVIVFIFGRKQFQERFFKLPESQTKYSSLISGGSSLEEEQVGNSKKKNKKRSRLTPQSSVASIISSTSLSESSSEKSN